MTERFETGNFEGHKTQFDTSFRLLKDMYSGEHERRLGEERGSPLTSQEAAEEAGGNMRVLVAKQCLTALASMRSLSKNPAELATVVQHTDELRAYIKEKRMPSQYGFNPFNEPRNS